MRHILQKNDQFDNMQKFEETLYSIQKHFHLTTSL